MPIIAIDGPAASGKGTLARKLAQYFDYAYLDTGSLYRAVGLLVARAGGEADNEQDALAAVSALNQCDLSKIGNDPEIKSESTGGLASKAAAIPAVREHLIAFQRDFAQTPPDNKAGAVLDGRDIGTVICPEADAKLFITATVETRAKRRFLEQFGPKGQTADYQTILQELILRDDRDRNRSIAPLKAAENAHLLDTTNSDIEAVFEMAVKIISDEMTDN